MTNPMNPRQIRAFAHTANFYAKTNPTPENVSKALAYQGQLRNGPKKSQSLGSAALKELDDSHVFHVNWTVAGMEGVGNFGGKVIPLGVAKALVDETAHNKYNPDDKLYDAWGAAITSGPSWMSSSTQPSGVRFNSFIKPSEALELASGVTYDIDGKPRTIPAEVTVLGALSHVIADVSQKK